MRLSIRYFSRFIKKLNNLSDSLEFVINKKVFILFFLVILMQQSLWCGINALKESDTILKFSKPEQEYIEKLPILRYSADPDWMPYESFTPDGSHVGIVSDILKIITERSNIKLIKIQPQSWVQVIDWMKEGYIDVFSDTDDSVLYGKVAFTKPFLTDNVVIISGDIKNLKLNSGDIINNRLVMVKDYGYVNAFIKKYSPPSFVFVNTITEAFEAVRDGKADYTITSEYEAARMIFLKFNSLYISGNADLTTNLAFAFNDKYKDIVPIFNKVIDTLTDEDRISIKNRWIPMKIINQGYKNILYLSVFFSIMFAIGYYIYRNLSKELEIRKQLQLDLKSEKNKFEILFMNSADGNTIILNGKFVLCNKAFLDILQMKENDIIGKTPVTISPEYQPDGQLTTAKAKALTNIVLSEGQVRFEWVHTTSKNQTVWCDVALTKISYYGQEAIYSQIRNIDEKKMLEESLINLKIKAEHANNAKSLFLANMSHEIRTPMNAVIGFTELLDKSDGLRSVQKNYIKSIKNGAKNLLVIINDILDLSKIESGKIEIKKELFDIFILIEDIKSVFYSVIVDKEIEFNFAYDSDIPKILLLDQIRLRQILFNIIGNAIKFTEKGSINFSVKVNHIDYKLQILDVSIIIADTGIGISPLDQEKIFKEFEQSDNQSTRKYGGTGLGLTISRKLTELMGGTITLESELGKGSEFTINFPSVEYSTTDIVNQNYIDDILYTFKKAKILSVDDVKDNLELLYAILSEHPFDIIEAHNGEEALKQLALHHFDLVITDIRMPLMDGKVLLSEMKKNQKWKKIPVIAVTASVLREEKAQLIEYGFNDVVAKPYHKVQIESAMSKFIIFTQQQVCNENKSIKITLNLKGNIQKLYKEAFGDRIQNQVKRNNFSEIKMLVEDFRVFLQQNPNREFETVSNMLENAINEFNIVDIDSIFRILIDNLEE